MCEPSSEHGFQRTFVRRRGDFHFRKLMLKLRVWVDGFESLDFFSRDPEMLVWHSLPRLCFRFRVLERRRPRLRQRRICCYCSRNSLCSAQLLKQLFPFLIFSVPPCLRSESCRDC